MGPTASADHEAIVQALVAAAAAAGRAPSIHNTQPWRWRIHDGVADLRADMRRHLAAADPERHMLLVSCGAALHHAWVALGAEGFAAEVAYLPDASDPDLLARVSVTGRTPVTPAAVRLVQTMAIRHTDRRPLLDEPVPGAALEALRAATAAYGIGLDVLRRDQIVDLAAAISYGQRGMIEDEVTRAELARWTSGSHPDGTGVPDAVIPAAPPQTTVPGRDFGHPGTLPISTGHDGAATYAILYGDD
jgi:nitroreductase